MRGTRYNRCKSNLIKEQLQRALGFPPKLSAARFAHDLGADADVVLGPEVTVRADVPLFDVTLLDAVLLRERPAVVAGRHEMPFFAVADGAGLRGRGVRLCALRRWLHGLGRLALGSYIAPCLLA